MNRNISNFYSKLIDDGAATERDIYDALFAGIRNEDLNLVEKSLGMLPSQAKWDNDDYPDNIAQNPKSQTFVDRTAKLLDQFVVFFDLFVQFFVGG